jgi:hypothetical protein
VALLSGYVPEGQLLSGLIIYTALSYWLPLIVGAIFAGRQLWEGIACYGENKKMRTRETTETPRPTAAALVRSYNGE